MKVLWFSNTAANADEYFNNQLKGTGGWLKALDQELQKHVSLHVAFYHKSDSSFNYQNTRYYPLLIKRRPWKKVLRKLGFSFVVNDEDLQQYLDIIYKVKPDVIHIHGTENPFGCIVPHTKVPVVVSIQGNITVYFHKFLSGFEKKYLFKCKVHLMQFASVLPSTMFFTEYNTFKKMALIERINLSKVRYIIGRTDWDRRITRVLAPQCKYFHNDEILRNSFYNAEWRMPDNSETFVIHTTNGNALYKGFETLCHSLKLLNDYGLKCEWRVAGISQSDLIYYLTKEKLNRDFPQHGLILMGNLSEYELVKSLLNSNVYVMPSHIENSPNNLCEAMILGMPCISTFVGGSGSLIQDKMNGLLVQSGDPWAIAGAIIEIAENNINANRLGENARLTALKKHNKEVIVRDLLEVYNQVLADN